VRIFGKRADGSRAPANGVLLSASSCSAGRVELQTRFSREPVAHAVGDALLVGRRLRSHEVPENVSTIIDLTSEFLDPASVRAMPLSLLPVLDASAPAPEALAELVRRIALPPAGRLLIHCANGHGRAGSSRRRVDRAAPGELARKLGMLRAARPRIRLRRCQRESLEAASRILARRLPASRPIRVTRAMKNKQAIRLAVRAWATARQPDRRIAYYRQNGADQRACSSGCWRLFGQRHRRGCCVRYSSKKVGRRSASHAGAANNLCAFQAIKIGKPHLVQRGATWRQTRPTSRSRANPRRPLDVSPESAPGAG